MSLIDEHYDVVVLGGGLCGFAAARACVRAGRRTLLVERRPVLGWESTWALSLEFAGGTSEASIWLAQAAEKAGGLRDGRLDAAVLEILLDRELGASGAAFLYYAQPVALNMDENGVRGVVLAGKSGEIRVHADAFIDATDNALLWRLAGHPVHPSCPVARFTIDLNGAADAAFPAQLPDGEGIGRTAVRHGVWPGEVALESECPSHDVGAARRAIPAVLRHARQHLDGIQGAMVAHVSVEPFPVEPVVSVPGLAFRSAIARNLFAGGRWASGGSEAQSPVAQALDLGDSVGREVARVVPGLGHRRGEAPAVQSIAGPPVYTTDVLVAGGGTAGALAAIAAGREGAKTTLIESATFLGGIGSGGGIHVYYHGVPGGIQDEVDARVAAITPLFGPPDKVVGFHPEAKKVVLQQMAEEAGVRLAFHTTITGAEVENMPTALPARPGDRPHRRLRGINVAQPDGAATYRAEVVIDSTGDADVAFMAGVPFTYGRETDCLTHAYSLSAGRVDPKGKLLVTNFDAGYCDPTDIVDLTRARRRGLEHYWREKFTPEQRLAYIAPLIGLRNSRQIVGEYRLTLFDEIASRQFPDVIAYAYSHYDNHAYDYENESDEAMFWVWVLGNWVKRIGSEIPYRCLLPLEVEGLLVACRAVSVTHDAHNQLRMQRDLQRIGEAAGVAAALAARLRVFPRDVPIQDLQARLFRSGALGDRRTRELPAGASVPVHNPSDLPTPDPAQPVPQCIQALGTETQPQAVLQLCLRGQDAVPALLDVVRTGTEKQRQWGSVALAMLNRPEAAPGLVECVRQRTSDIPAQSRKAAPIWVPAMLLAGRIQAREAVPAIAAVLADKAAGLDALIAAVRALGRIGDSTAVPAVEAMLKRDDLPRHRVLQKSSGVAADVVEDCLWQVELAAAETLARLGTLRPDLVDRHRSDPRAYVRRYAEKVQQELQRK